MNPWPGGHSVAADLVAHVAAVLAADAWRIHCMMTMVYLYCNISHIYICICICICVYIYICICMNTYECMYILVY